jgi:asparagine synthetase B (glutamine-hydrolysing)
MIFNDKEIFTKGMTRDAEVDSEAILALLSKHSKGDKLKLLFDKLEGNYALAMISKDRPDKLTLVRKDNPLDIYYDSENDILYFCSEREIMQEGLGIRPLKKRGFHVGEGDFHFYEVENNHALIINDEGLQLYKRYQPKEFGFFGSYRGSRYSYLDIDDDVIEVECPYCLTMTKYNWVNLFNRCEHCGSVIKEEDLYYV